MVDTGALLLHGMWNLSRPGIEPMSFALADRFLPTVPPEKSEEDLYKERCFFFFFFFKFGDRRTLLAERIASR